MFEGLFRKAKEVFSKLTSWQPLYRMHWQPLEKINVELTQLCPSNLSDEQKRAWLEAYLRKFKTPSMLLWADEAGQLHVCYATGETIHHVHLSSLTVAPESKRIFEAGEPIQTIKPIIALLKKQDPEIPVNFAIPTLDQLLRYKQEVHIAKKHITPEIVNKVKQTAQQDKENFEACENCGICLQKYTKVNPPVLVRNTPSVYHQACIERYIFGRIQSGYVVLDPLSNNAIPVPSGYRNWSALQTLSTWQVSTILKANTLITDEAYLKVLGYYGDMAGRLNDSIAILSILQDEIAKLRQEQTTKVAHSQPALIISSRDDGASTSAPAPTQPQPVVDPDSAPPRPAPPIH